MSPHINNEKHRVGKSSKLYTETINTKKKYEDKLWRAHSIIIHQHAGQAKVAIGRYLGIENKIVDFIKKKL